MNIFRLPLIIVVLAGLHVAAQTQAPPPEASYPPITTPGQPGQETLTPEQLEQLLGPIALYPDALIALILPASTVPTDIVLAARQVRENPNDRSQIEHRAWDESVKSLTNFPEVLLWLDENLPWTQQLGEAFLEQPAEVMQAIQRLRAMARAAGTLIDTPQQQVVAETNVIRIVPAQPDIIYVPRYEPEVVFLPQPVYYSRPFLSFGFGVGVGSWLAYDCDWRRHTIWTASRHRPWVRHDWRRPLLPISPGFKRVPPPGIKPWKPPVHSHRPPGFVRHGHSHTPRSILRPTPVGSYPRTFGPVTELSPLGNVRTFTPSSRDSMFTRPSTITRRTNPNPVSPSVEVGPRANVPSPAVTIPGTRRGGGNDANRGQFDRTRTVERPSHTNSNIMGPVPSVSAPTPNRSLTQPPVRSLTQPPMRSLTQPSTRSLTQPSARSLTQPGGTTAPARTYQRPSPTQQGVVAPVRTYQRPEPALSPMAPARTYQRPTPSNSATSSRVQRSAPAAPAVSPAPPAASSSSSPNRQLSQPSGRGRSEGSSRGGDGSSSGSRGGGSWRRGS